MSKFTARLHVSLIVGVLFYSCQQKEVQVEVLKNDALMDEYLLIKKNLEPQGYTITTDSISNIFIDHSVKIHYDKTKLKNKK